MPSALILAEEELGPGYHALSAGRVATSAVVAAVRAAAALAFSEVCFFMGHAKCALLGAWPGLERLTDPGGLRPVQSLSATL